MSNLILLGRCRPALTAECRRADSPTVYSAGRQQVMPAADTRPEPFSDTLSGWAVLPLPGAELRRTIARCRRRSWDRGCDGRILR